jgi:uncharacterized membrane protein YfhO
MKKKSQTTKQGSQKNTNEKIVADIEVTKKTDQSWLHRNGVLVSFVSVLLLTIILMGDFIFGDKIFMFSDIGSDTYHFSYPFYQYVSGVLHQFEIPKWTFNQGLGQNIFPAYLGDLPNLLSYVFFADNVAVGFIWIQLIKILPIGVVFFLYLRKIEIAPFAAIFGSVLYATSGFVIIGSSWGVFTTEVLYLAFLLYSVECFRRDKNIVLLPLAVGFIAAYNPVSLYLNALFLAAYLLLTAYIYETPVKKSALLFGKIILLSAIGVGMGSFFMLGNLNIMLESPRGSGNVSLASTLLSRGVFYTESAKFYQTFLLRLFSNDMVGYANAFNGWGNYLEAPMQYCGLLSLLLIPQLFFTASKKVRIAAGLALFAIVIFIVFPFFRYAFWLFTGDYFRAFSLFICTTQILLAIVALQKIITNRKVNLIALIISFILLSAMVTSSDIANPSLIFPVMFFLSAATVLLYLIAKAKAQQTILIVLSVVTFIEISLLTNGSFNERDAIKKEDLQYRIGFNDYTKEALAYIKSTDKQFYRVHKDYISSLGKYASFNNSLIQNYYGSSSYSSFNQKYYVEFLQKMGVISDSSEIATRWILGLNNRPLLKQLVSNKYMLTKGSGQELRGLGYDSLSTINDIRIFKNSNFLPLGFTYSKFITAEEMAKIPAFGRDIMILQAAVLSKDDATKFSNGFQQLTSNDTIGVMSMELYNNLTAALKADTLSISTFNQNAISGSIEVAEPKLFFLSIPYDKGWKAIIDGKEEQPLIVNYGFLGYKLGKGKHEFSLSYTPPFYTIGMWISIIALLGYIALIVLSRFSKLAA